MNGNMNQKNSNLLNLDLIGIISFDGITKNSLHVHPNQEYLLFPMGNKVTVKNITSGEQFFLSGHTNVISALCVSPCGKFIASGQINHLGFKAMVIVWDYEKKVMKSSYEIHKVRVEDLCFSSESNYLISLGGRDDGNIVIWNVRENEAICGSYASTEIAGSAWTVKRTNMRDQCFVSAGENTIKVWRINPETRKLNGICVRVGKIKRTINCVVIDNRDEIAYCGTSSGDIIKTSNYSEIFATSSKDDIRLWRVETQKELLRITISNFVCSNLCFSYDGKMIISAWNDGVIRAFAPQSGRLLFAIHNAHLKSVSAVVITKNGKKIVSAGCDGQIRIWDVKPDVQRLVCILKEHRGPVTSLHISKNDDQVISSSVDGTCIIWDIVQCTRKKVLMGNTMYMAACFTPNSVQVLTCGTDRLIGYWETLTASLIREVEGSGVGALNCVDISADCRHFVTGSNDSIVKLWHYQNAEITHIGLGHAAIITGIKFSPDGKYIVSVSADGAIIIWKCPSQLHADEQVAESTRSRSTCSIREEEFNKLRLKELKDDEESVSQFTTRPESAQSIKAVYNGDNSVLQKECNHTDLLSTACDCKQASNTKKPLSVSSRSYTNSPLSKESVNEF
ncbi:cilia- and flagella-associated protein 52-like isoform X2 [Leptopilina heterotoma]|uniref:cilia- and flagella-associated protein 52-like isoform X2 n=1 Tax=Leptopilina heterotoma TaxID=63436 RepID=UPI001CA93736|nr:cilia- and flagella-associated protein 52-like isoform X2 [Leptopilina heterotoma]